MLWDGPQNPVVKVTCCTSLVTFTSKAHRESIAVKPFSSGVAGYVDRHNGPSRHKATQPCSNMNMLSKNTQFSVIVKSNRKSIKVHSD